MPFLRAPSLRLLRTFSTTIPISAKSTKSRLRADHTDVPPYPYGPSYWYKQSNFGLYGGQTIQSGNNVSSITETKTRRTWHPNIHRKRLFSKSLNRFIRLRVSTRVLRTIDKVGGLDEYLLGEKAARLKELGMEGWKLRWRIMQTPAVKKRFNIQRVAMGLEQEGKERFGVGRPSRQNPEISDGAQATEEQVQHAIAEIDRDLDAQDVRAALEGEPAETEADGLMLEPGLKDDEHNNPTGDALTGDGGSTSQDVRPP